MADVVEPVIETIKETVAEVLNETSGVNATMRRMPSTPEGMAIAYGSLVFMALLPIFLGAFRSVKQEYDEEVKSTTSSDQGAQTAPERESNGLIHGILNGARPGEPLEGMTPKDAALFPLMASAALLGLYMVFKVFSASTVNLLLTAYFFVLGVFALTHLLTPVVCSFLPRLLEVPSFHFMFFLCKGRAIDQLTPERTRGGSNRHREQVCNVAFDLRDVLTVAICTCVGCWYFFKKHWIANNLFGLAFAINGVEFLQLPRISTGFILLVGLFFYDIFWVFGTDVMITVAKSFEAPIKLVFPQDLLENGPMEANNFAMLGLGDIVVPGIFIALLLRFDISRDCRRNGSKPYFYTGFVAYFLGLLLTIFVMHVYKHAQPALLYLVPMCLGAPMLMALIKGEVMQLINYEDEPILPPLAEIDSEYDSEEYEDDDGASDKKSD